MTERSTVRLTGGTDTILFGRGGYVLHDLDVGAPALTDGVTTAREVTLKGYILPEGESAAIRAAELEKLARRLRRIVSRPGGFLLTVDDRSLALTALKAPVFAHEAPLTGDEAAFFTLHAAAQDPAAAYFQAENGVAVHCRGWQGKLFFPLTFTGETLFGLRTSEGILTVDNPGDTDCGFTAALTAEGGSIESVTLTSPTGEHLTVTCPLADGETVYVDTRRRQKSVTVNGMSVMGTLSWDSTFFTLAPGENRLSWACEGNGSMVLRVTLTPRYL